jgi:hypothetical protein
MSLAVHDSVARVLSVWPMENERAAVKRRRRRESEVTKRMVRS